MATIREQQLFKEKYGTHTSQMMEYSHTIDNGIFPYRRSFVLASCTQEGTRLMKIWYVNLVLLGCRTHIPLPTTDYIKIGSRKNYQPRAGWQHCYDWYLSPCTYCMCNLGTKRLSALLSAFSHCVSNFFLEISKNTTPVILFMVHAAATT